MSRHAGICPFHVCVRGLGLEKDGDPGSEKIGQRSVCLLSREGLLGVSP